MEGSEIMAHGGGMAVGDAEDVVHEPAGTEGADADAKAAQHEERARQQRHAQVAAHVSVPFSITQHAQKH